MLIIVVGLRSLGKHKLLKKLLIENWLHVFLTNAESDSLCPLIYFHPYLNLSFLKLFCDIMTGTD